jgi:hypothetical protein
MFSFSLIPHTTTVSDTHVKEEDRRLRKVKSGKVT